MPDHKMFNERPESQDRALKVLEKLGYNIVARADADVKRGSHRHVLFPDELQNFLSLQEYPFGGALRRFSGGSVGKAKAALDVPLTQGLYAANKDIHDLITSGKSMEEILPDGSLQSFDIGYIDFENPKNNIFQVTDEFEVESANGRFTRPDIVVMVNGIPLVVVECKKSSVDVMEGVRQNIRNWGQDYIPQLFKYTQIVIAVNPDKVLYGTCGTSADYFVAWHEDDKEWLEAKCQYCSPDGQVKEQDRALISLLDPKRLLELVRNYIIYDNGVKKIARYKQYFAVKKCMERILRQDGAPSRSGVLWHTQGSGKSIIMIMLTKLIIRESMRPGSIIKKPRFIMVTDRVNLDKQIRDNFLHTQMSPHRAATGSGLVGLLDDEGNTVITALVNKFESAVKLKYTNPSENIFLFIDEGHRTQYGKLNIYMTATLPNAVKIAFTGTPLIKERPGLETARNTYQRFGKEIDRYTLQDAIDDHVTVPIVYEGRVIPQQVPSDQINKHLEHLTVGLTEDAKEDLKRKWSQFRALVKTKQRLNMIAFDIHEHFISYVRPKGFKAMLTCSSRAAAVEVYERIKRFGDIKAAVVITPNTQSEGDEETSSEDKKVIGDFFAREVDPLYRNNYELYEDSMTSRFVDPEGDVELLVVAHKLLTGFDAPVAAVLYVDKKLQDHTLLQAIARVNRVYENKDFGLVVDYIGIFKKLNSALDLYSDENAQLCDFEQADVVGVLASVQEEKLRLENAHAALWKLFDGIDPNEPSANVWQEHLRDYDLRKDFYGKLSTFAKMVDFLFTSLNLYETVGAKQSEQYRKEYLFFKKLKDSVSLRFNDSVDFSKYENGIRQLLDTYVNASDARIIIEPLDITNKAKMDEQLALLGSPEAKAEAIRTRQVEVLEAYQYDDPIMYYSFKERIEQTLEAYQKERDSERYLTSMERMAEDFRTGNNTVSYPQRIADDSDGKAFFGALSSGIRKSSHKDSPVDAEALATLALQIKDVIAQNAKRDWRDNIIVHRTIKSRLDDLLFDFMEKQGLQWSLDGIDIMIDEIMMTAKKRY